MGGGFTARRKELIAGSVARRQAQHAPLRATREEGRAQRRSSAIVLVHGIVRTGCCSGPIPALALPIAAAASSGVMNPAATSAFAAVVNFDA